MDGGAGGTDSSRTEKYGEIKRSEHPANHLNCTWIWNTYLALQQGDIGDVLKFPVNV